MVRLNYSIGILVSVI